MRFPFCEECPLNDPPLCEATRAKMLALPPQDREALGLCLAGRYEARVAPDQLTGLDSGSTFITKLKHRFAQDRFRRSELFTDEAGREWPTALALLIDGNNFGMFNKEHGHGNGNLLIRALGQRIGAILRPGDLRAMPNLPGEEARVGGDEFSVGIFGLSKVEAHALYDRLQTELSGKGFLTKLADGSTTRHTATVAGAYAPEVCTYDEFVALQTVADLSLGEYKRSERTAQPELQMIRLVGGIALSEN